MAASDILAILDRMYAHQERKEERAVDRSLQLMQMGIASETRKNEAAQNVMLKEYYRKQEDVQKTEETLAKYDGIQELYQSNDARNMLDMVDEQNNLDMGEINQNLSQLTEYQGDLNSLLTDMTKQASELKAYTTDFFGANKVLQGHEYDKFREFALRAEDDPAGGLGWTNTAGSDYEYGLKDPTEVAAQAITMSDKFKEGHTAGAQGSYAVMQSMFTREPGKSNKTLVKQMSYQDVDGKIQEPSERVALYLENAASQPDFDDFMVNLYANAPQQVTDYLENNPRIATSYANLTRDYNAINILNNELAGINQPEKVTKYDQFIKTISEVKDEKALFMLFEAAAAGGTEAEIDQYFKAIETQLGVSNAGDRYTAFKDAGKDDLPTNDTVGSIAMQIPMIQAVGWTVQSINETLYNQGVDIYNMAAVPYNWLTTLMTGYNPGLSGTKFFEPYANITGLTEEGMKESLPKSYYKDFAGEGHEFFGVKPGNFSWELEDSLDNIKNYDSVADFMTRKGK